MKRIINNVLLFGMALFAFSCVEPESPTATDMSYGKWTVERQYINDQAVSAFNFDLFLLNRDGSFSLEDANGFLTSGSWVATDTQLTLTGNSGDVLQFSIEYQSYTRLELVQDLSNTIGVFRFFMEKDDSDDYSSGI